MILRQLTAKIRSIFRQKILLESGFTVPKTLEVSHMKKILAILILTLFVSSSAWADAYCEASPDLCPSIMVWVQVPEEGYCRIIQGANAVSIMVYEASGAFAGEVWVRCTGEGGQNCI